MMKEGNGGSDSNGSTSQKFLKLTGVSTPSLGSSLYVLLCPSGITRSVILPDMASVIMMFFNSDPAPQNTSFVICSCNVADNYSFKDGFAVFPLFTKDRQEFTAAGSYYVWLVRMEKMTFEYYRSSNTVDFDSETITMNLSCDFLTGDAIDVYN